MYIYIIKYNGEVIAAASSDDTAADVIRWFTENGKDVKTELFEKEPIRFFS